MFDAQSIIGSIVGGVIVSIFIYNKIIINYFRNYSQKTLYGRRLVMAYRDEAGNA